VGKPQGEVLKIVLAEALYDKLVFVRGSRGLKREYLRHFFHMDTLYRLFTVRVNNKLYMIISGIARG
jgi:hypothetical protein